MIGLSSLSLAFARQLQGGSQQMHQWAGGNEDLGEGWQGLSDLLQVKHPEYESIPTGTNPHCSKAYTVGVPVAPVGELTFWALQDTYKPRHDNTVSRQNQLQHEEQAYSWPQAN